MTDLVTTPRFVSIDPDKYVDANGRIDYPGIMNDLIAKGVGHEEIEPHTYAVAEEAARRSEIKHLRNRVAELQDGLAKAWDLFENAGIMSQYDGRTGNPQLDALAALLDELASGCSNPQSDVLNALVSRLSEAIGKRATVKVNEDPCTITMAGVSSLTETVTGTLEKIQFFPCGPVGILVKDDGQRVVFDCGLDVIAGKIAIIWSEEA